MDRSEIFEMPPFPGAYASTESEMYGESFEDEEARARRFAARGGPGIGRGTRGPGKSPIATKKRPRRPMAAPRPLPPKPPLRPRPRGTRPAWPPGGGAYYPIPTVPLVEPSAPVTADGSSSDAQLRCVRQCLGPGADAGTASAPAPAPAPDQSADGTAPTQDQSADGGAPAQDQSADGGAPAQGDAAASEFEGEFGDVIGRIGRGIGDVIGRAGEALRGCKITDLTAQSDRGVRKGTRDPASVYALVLHQMACCFRRRDPLRSYLRIKAHFAILPEGQILQLHPVSALIWASHGFNSKSVAVEFAGNFPSTRGKWWKGETYGRNQVTPAQITAGRCLVQHLIRTMGLRVILAHRQSSDMRENDPGPDIWYHVGQWAVDTLRLSDGGPGFKVGTGKPIPDEWRRWGRRGVAPTPELELSSEDEEGELWRGAPEGEVGLEVSLPAAIADPRAAGPGIYTVYLNGRRLYVGRSNDLRRRLQQHLWCLTHLGVGATNYTVKLTPMRGASPTQLARVESAVVDRFGRQRTGGLLTNVKARELEQELFEALGA